MPRNALERYGERETERERLGERETERERYGERETERERGENEIGRTSLSLVAPFLIFVPRTGIEPALPCDNQILSLARLPIPPSGLFSSKHS